MADAKQGGSAAESTRSEMTRGEAAGQVPGTGLVHQARTMAMQVQGNVMAMPAQRRTWLLCGLLFVGAVCAGMMWFWQRPDWRVLFSGLDGKDVQTVSQELAAAGIAFETTPDGGGIRVPADMLDKARMEVATKGMPQSGRMGFEIFDTPKWVGSEFDEHVNYQRALEGELERTIGSLGVVRTARVHLVLPEASLFTAQEKVAKASVVLKLRKATVDQDQADGIRGIVAGAVQGLSADNVTLVDADGRANLQVRGHGSAAEGEMEHTLETKLVAMLEPLAGHDNVRATVNVSYDEGRVERTDEVYDPAQSALLTNHKSEQNTGVKAPVGGVPGTASNTPAASAQGSVQAAGAAAAAGVPPLLKDGLPVYPSATGGGSQNTKEESGTYGVTRHVMHSEMGPGRIQRVTAAVVVNDRQVMEGSGKTQHAVWKPRGVDDMKHLEELARAAVGFDEKRGDNVVMSNISFTSNVPEVPLGALAKVAEEGKSFLHTEPGLIRTAVTGALALAVVMLVLRPVAKQLMVTLNQPVLLAAGTPLGSSVEQAAAGLAASGTGEHGAPGAAGQPDSASPTTRRALKQGQVMFDHVADQIEREPVQSTRLLEVWIGQKDGGE